MEEYISHMNALFARLMYWTDYGSFDKIERASMDGTSRTVIINTGLGTPYGLTLDYDTQTLYWVDYTLDRLESSSVDGSNRNLLTTISIVCPYGITFFNEKLYWGDWCRHTIFTTSVNTPDSVSSVYSTSYYDPHRMHVISEDRQLISGMVYHSYIIFVRVYHARV